MKGPSVHSVPHHRPALLPVPSASLQHRCCRHDNAVPEEFAVIAAEVLDCFATGFYAAPVGLRYGGELLFECALVIDEEDARLRLRLRCSVDHGGKPDPVVVETPAVLFLMAALRETAEYKQLDLSPVVCTDDLKCEFMTRYPGVLTMRDLPGMGDVLPSGEPCWPTTVLRAAPPSGELALRARTIIEWLRSGAEAQLH